jgi:hypothetical protein
MINLKAIVGCSHQQTCWSKDQQRRFNLKPIPIINI